ncbi:sodium:alanine symporter family protein [Atopobacter sp. AH10]|uniref:alanine/glycine:cation symporter family protein n=1 Tax=Atopobacter sp. AH10 TaxID=2315861 RepID=UPI000EF263BA|nr:sodium:alanine symporter family protein [Atopobacter sp. AH10]RLK63635.1 sodium:alanine symporter family protein [Atopobacter sp. AH10]
MDQVNDLILKINDVLSNNILVLALLGCGLFFTIYTRGVQFRKLGPAFKSVFGGVFKKSEDGVSSFQALAVAIAAQVGTGNVAGVATAIIAGGPGAIFWMWIAAILGMGTIFAEACLAQKFRRKDSQGNYVGGPSYYLTYGVGAKFPKLGKILAVLFSIFITVALGFIGNMVQSNSIATAMQKAFQIPVLWSGVIIAILGGLIFAGGIKRIANFAQLIVPVMAVIYLVLAVLILFNFRSQLLPSLALIFKAAFNPQAALGGALGVTVRQAITKGVARGLFSNEAGMGSTPHAHATAMVDHPADQGYIAMVGVFIDTIVVCTATALIILVTGAHTSGLEGALVTQEAFQRAFGAFGAGALAISLAFFAFSTVIGWYYFGETNMKFLFGEKALWPYRILVMFCIVFGSVQKIDVVWNMSDLFNSFMVVPNVIGIILLHKYVREMQEEKEALEISSLDKR